MKTHVLTVCNLCTLPQALVLREGLRAFQPDWVLHIGLVDLPRHVPAGLIPEETLLDVQRIGLPDFEGLTQQYTAFEFTNLTKPFFARYLFAAHPDLEQLVYLAPETQVFAPLTALETAAQTHDLVLLSRLRAVLPGPAGRAEKQFLNTGTYQSGCWALRRSDSARAFLAWWSDRLACKGWLDLCQGYGSDQLWLDLVPAYFQHVHLLRETGYAVGTWNRHEHPLRGEPSAYHWGTAPLTTVQWSDQRPVRRLSAEQADRWRELEAAYRSRLNANGSGTLHAFVPAWGLPDPHPAVAGWRRELARPFRRLIQTIDTFQPDWMYR